MRIAMIGSRGTPAGLGGVERVAEELAVELTALGHEVWIYSRRGYTGDRPPPAGVGRWFSPGLGGKHLDTLTHSATAAADVSARAVDLVHVHSPGPALWSWLPRLAGLPVVLTVHAPDWQREKWSPPARWALRAGLAVGARTAREVTAVSEPLAAELGERLARPVHFVPNPARPPRGPAPPLPSELPLEAEGYALYVGRIVPEKRLSMLLEAWAEVEGLKLAVAGPWDDSPYGRACRRDAPAGVEFLGPQYGDSLDALYAHAAMVVQPSVLEGASLVLMEAALRERLVVAADTPANRDVLGETAAYFPIDNPYELIRILNRYRYCTQERIGLARAGRQRVLSRNAPQTAAEALQAIYCRALRLD
mgnify:FL=1